MYVTILASLPSLSTGLRSSINSNLTEIVELHEEILGHLHRAVPHSEYTQMEIPPPATTPGASVLGHRRWKSLGAIPENSLSWLQNVPGMTAEPQVAAEVAKIFSQKVSHSFLRPSQSSSAVITNTG